MMKRYSENQGKAKQSCDLFSVALLDRKFLQKKPIPPSPTQQSAQGYNNLQFNKDLCLRHCLIIINGHHLLKASCMLEQSRQVAKRPHSLVVEQDQTVCSKCQVTCIEQETRAWRVGLETPLYRSHLNHVTRKAWSWPDDNTKTGNLEKLGEARSTHTGQGRCPTG